MDERFALNERTALIDGYRALAETEPEAGLFRRLGICLADSGSLDDALAAFRRALALDRSDEVSRRRITRIEMMKAKPVVVARKVRQSPSRPLVTKASLSQEQARQKFLRAFPLGFADPGYYEEERRYKSEANKDWQARLSREVFRRLLSERDYEGISQALRSILSKNKLNLPSTFELMAINRLTMNPESQPIVAEHLYALIYGNDFGSELDRFVLALQRLNTKGLKPFTWPVVTLFPFIADPTRHMFVKPEATKVAAARLGIELNYKSIPNVVTYGRVMELTQRLLDDLKDLRPADLIDIQSFIWVTHSDGYGIGP